VLTLDEITRTFSFFFLDNIPISLKMNISPVGDMWKKYLPLASNSVSRTMQSAHRNKKRIIPLKKQGKVM